MYKFIFLLALLITYSHAKTYSLFLASSKSLEEVINHYHIITNITSTNETVIRVHKKRDYSVIIRKIPTITQAKNLQKLFHNTNRYKDSYIKAYKVEPIYEIVNYQIKESPKKEVKVKRFTQEVENSNEYITASTYFNTKQYEKSYKLFYKLFLKHNYNKNINYFLAKSAYHTKKYDEATAAYERVLNLDSNFNQARYDYARILFKLKQNKEAKEEFNKLLSSNIKESIKKRIKEFLKILNKQNRQKTISANLAIGFSRSSNVNNGLISPDYRLPALGNLLYSGEEPIADNSVYQLLNLNFFKYYKEKPLRLKNSFLIYNKNYFKEEQEDITAISYKPSLSYFNKNLNQLYTIQLTADKIFRNTNDDFYSFAISPKITTKNLQAYLKYQRIMYTKEESKEKDFEKYELYTKVNLFKYMSYNTGIYKNKKVKDIRTDIDKYTIGNGIDLFYNLTENDKINLNYQFDYSKYKDNNIGYYTKRKDRKHSFEISLKHSLKNNDLITTSLSYIKNYSNQDPYIYDEKEFKLNYLKSLSW